MMLTKEERDKLRAWHGTGPEDVEGMRIIELLDDLDAKDADISRAIAAMHEGSEKIKAWIAQASRLERERDEARSEVITLKGETASLQNEVRFRTQERDQARDDLQLECQGRRTALRERDEARAELASHIATWDGDGWRDQAKEAQAEVARLLKAIEDDQTDVDLAMLEYYQLEYTKLRTALCELQAIVNEQAEDEGLWALATTIHEAYIQERLRGLHTAIEQAAVLVTP